MKNLLLQILKGYYLHTMVSSELLINSLESLTSHKITFTIISETDNVLVIGCDDKKSKITFTFNEKGYITDINI